MVSRMPRNGSAHGQRSDAPSSAAASAGPDRRRKAAAPSQSVFARTIGARPESGLQEFGRAIQRPEFKAGFLEAVRRAFLAVDNGQHIGDLGAGFAQHLD